MAAFRAALQEQTRERVPLDWAGTQMDLGNALARLGERESGTARQAEPGIASVGHANITVVPVPQPMPQPPASDSTIASKPSAFAGMAEVKIAPAKETATKAARTIFLNIVVLPEVRSLGEPMPDSQQARGEKLHPEPARVAERRKNPRGPAAFRLSKLPDFRPKIAVPNLLNCARSLLYGALFTLCGAVPRFRGIELN